MEIKEYQETRGVELALRVGRRILRRDGRRMFMDRSASKSVLLERVGSGKQRNSCSLWWRGIGGGRRGTTGLGPKDTGVVGDLKHGSGRGYVGGRGGGIAVQMVHQ